MMRIAIDHFLLAWNRDIRDPKLLMIGAKVDSSSALIGSSFLKYHNLASPLTRIIAASSYQESQEDLSYWLKQNVCKTDGKSGVYDYYVNKYIARLAVGNLDLELTKSVRQIKSQLGAGASIGKVANEFKLASQTCPDEQWKAKAKDEAVTISFSHPPNWTALGMDEKENIDRFTYTIDPKKIKIKPV